MCKKENCCSDSGVQRKPGFYWVRCKEYKTAIYDGWAVREWAGIWVDIQCVEDDYWLEIDERRIERQPKESIECGCNDDNSEIKKFIKKTIQDYIESQKI